ncbi:hypothetical protein MIR68_000982 [Amoeboaphelidium protococcarum]|nr:hypothetical protein MIR68_000982 [Amoeboaphelidium protococcarum]
MVLVKFQKIQSEFKIDFWTRLSNYKLNDLKLNDEVIPISAQISANAVIFDHTSLNNNSVEQVEKTDDESIQNSLSFAQAVGVCKNLNTLKEFNEFNKQKFLLEYVDSIYNEMSAPNQQNQNFFKYPCRFLMVTFADVKKYKFYYFVAYPVVLFDVNYLPSVSNIEHQSQELASLQPLFDEYLHEQSANVCFYDEVGKNLIQAGHGWQTGYSLVVKQRSNHISQTTTDSQLELCWQLRNFLSYLQVRYKLEYIKIYVWNDQLQQYTLYHANLPLLNGYGSKSYKAIRWEKAQVSIVDISDSIDPSLLCNQSIDLNLRLMKWRMVQQLDLDTIAQQKVLVLGMGTLGCNVVRTLIGWNVTDFLIVDNGKVSYSNLPRQPLYTFADYGRNKVDVARTNLLAINPSYKVRAEQLTIPCPGHYDHLRDRLPLNEQSLQDKDIIQLQRDLGRLENLIKECNVIFLLTDSRESRYIPTLMAKFHNKLCINAALGFDSYLIMRHGLRDSNLGCYFCNDVVGPSNSMTARSLDQECTVTRPALAPMCSAQAVELFISLLQQQKQQRQPAGSSEHRVVGLNEEIRGSELGILPHTVRYYLRYGQAVFLDGRAYDKCTACSMKVIEAYQQSGIQFLISVLINPKLAEKVSELTALHEQVEQMNMAEWTEGEESDTDEKQ